MSLPQIYQKLETAVLALVCADASLHERLDAAIAAITTISEKELPPDSRKEFGLLLDKIHAYHLNGEPADLQPALARAIFELLRNFVGYTAVFGGFTKI